MGFFSDLFESKEERERRLNKEMNDFLRESFLKHVNMDEVRNKCSLLKKFFPYGYKQIEKKFENTESPYKEVYISDSGEDIVIEESKLLVRNTFSNTPLREVVFYGKPKLKDEYYDIIDGKYVFNILKAFNAFHYLKFSAGYDPLKPEKDKKAKEEKERQERLKREEQKKREKENELIRKGVAPQLYSTLKTDKEQILQILKDNNITCFYHFTSRKNIPSIIKNGGLFSWNYLVKHSIVIPKAGGGDTSRSLDIRYGLEDYVRLSFCSNHPMSQRLRDDGEEIIVLRIDIRVAILGETLFSNMNATDNNHLIGGKAEDLRRVDFYATQRSRIYSYESDFKKHQAEILVKTFIPMEYILTNLDYYNK